MTASFRLKAMLATGALALGILHAPYAAAQEKVLKVVPHSNLAILDPIWTTQYMVRNHGYMIYDTLFATDADSKIQPQMVDTWTVSDDKLQWTFKLRKDLSFHDGKPVTGEDVVASLQRWGKRDAMGQKLFSFVDRIEATEADTFRIVLREPCGFVLEALGKPSSIVPFIMPKRVAETPADQQIDDYTGSGPYRFMREEFKPGDKAVYAKFDGYVPRDEPPSGTAGGKRVYVDRVEWNLALRDPQQQVNALIRGEVDMIEQPAFESYPPLRADPNVEIVNWNPLGFQYMLRFNHLHKPFDDPKVKAAAMMAMNQQAFLKAQVGDDELFKVCPSMFTCGTPYASEAGAEAQNMGKGNLKKAQELLKASGYDGTPVVIMKPTDLPSIGKLPDVAALLLRQAGFKVDLQSMDWNTLVSRRAKKDPPSEGGWNIFATAWVSPDIWNPLTNAALIGSGANAWFGWADSPELEKLRDQFARETDDAQKKALAEQIQKAAFEYGTHAPLGEYVQPAAVRKGITGLVTAPGNLYWNIQKP